MNATILRLRLRAIGPVDLARDWATEPDDGGAFVAHLPDGPFEPVFPRVWHAPEPAAREPGVRLAYQIQASDGHSGRVRYVPLGDPTTAGYITALRRILRSQAVTRYVKET